MLARRVQEVSHQQGGVSRLARLAKSVPGKEAEKEETGQGGITYNSLSIPVHLNKVYEYFIKLFHLLM